MKFPDINDLAPEEMEDAHVNVWERGDAANAVDSDIPVPVEDGRKYQNLWASEDDPRAVPLPAEICPVHHLACSKGICEDMSKIIRDKKRAELKEKWEKEKKKKGTRFYSSFLTTENLPDWLFFYFFSGKKKKEALGSGDEKNKVDIDGDNFAKVVTRPKGKRVQDGPAEPSYTGRMRAFSDDPVSSDPEPDVNGEASGSGPKVSSAPETERQLFHEW